ncbi:bromodomain-containing protein 7 isoform X2 [Corythoichthys intestinalis]|uniref:bromodomain-containing protein 7 isoform X2 n=1 Tax=Corythoichthys intestinalis TaxID=161448 RepID=UPI0025A5998D|nr:bromodomain-containing protein 7 isoform X2 [Corythoichthys intestinalis]
MRERRMRLFGVSKGSHSPWIFTVGPLDLQGKYTERPLKLVLKVSGNEVTTGSSSRDTFYDEQSPDCDKAKDKKKKKKKEKERNCGTPESDKGKKKVIKRKKAQEVDGEDERENCRTPIRSELDKLEEKAQTPLQEALNQLIRQLQRKDPSAFFTFPVTDLIAPGYSIIIKHPMDFSTMKDKVKKQYYASLDELKADFKTMCENAMAYNKPETIYHKAARKLLHSGLKILSKERLQSLKQSIEFMSGLAPSDKVAGKRQHQGAACLVTKREVSRGGSEGSQTPGTPRSDKCSKEEEAEKELEEIRKVIEESGGKLSNRVLQCDLEFSRQRQSDGSTTLAFVNPADPSAGETGYCAVKLGMMSTRLQSGVNCLQGFREDKRNRITPVSYMNYGPFTSYAPTYDSSFSNVSKDDSDLIYSLYGDESSLQGSDSLSEFLSKSDEYVYKMADNLLDAMTNGEHSKTLKEIEPQVEEPLQEDKADADVSQLDALGCSKTEEPLAPELSGVETDVQQKLDETTLLLRELQEAQRERLSTKQPPNMICLLAPTTKELELAEKVTGNLAELTGQVAPCDISSIWAIRKAMGIALPPGPLVDLTSVHEMGEPMDTTPSYPEPPPITAV